MRPLAAFVSAMIGGLIVIPHVSPDWKIIVGSFFGGFAAQMITRVNLVQLAREAARVALTEHEARFGHGECEIHKERSHG